MTTATARTAARSCGKRSFSKLAAKAYARRIRKRAPRVIAKGCESCHAWHLEER